MPVTELVSGDDLFQEYQRLRGTNNNQIIDSSTRFRNENIGGRNTTQLVTQHHYNEASDNAPQCQHLAGLYSNINSATITLRKANGRRVVGPIGGNVCTCRQQRRLGRRDWGFRCAEQVFFVEFQAASHCWIGGGGGGTLGALQDTIANVSGNDPANTFYVFNSNASLVDHWVTTANAGVHIRRVRKLTVPVLAPICESSFTQQSSVPFPIPQFGQTDSYLHGHPRTSNTEPPGLSQRVDGGLSQKA